MTPDYVVYRGVEEVCSELAYTVDVIDEVNDGENFPIIRVGESSVSDGVNKRLKGTVNQTINVFDVLENREEVSMLTARLRDRLMSGIKERGGYKLTDPRVTMLIRKDTSTNKDLWQYILDYRVTYNK